MVKLANVFFLSSRKDFALRLAIADLTIHLAPFDPVYKGRVAFHACQYKNDRDRAESLKNLSEAGFSEEEEDLIPEESILGWGKLQSTKEYDARSFDIDSSFHGYKNFDLFRAEEKWDRVFGWVLTEQRYLSFPVMGIKGRDHGDWWTAGDPFRLLCLERAFRGSAID